MGHKLLGSFFGVDQIPLLLFPIAFASFFGVTRYMSNLLFCFACFFSIFLQEHHFDVL